MAINDPIQIDGVGISDLVTITPTAIQTIRTLLLQREIPDHALRVFVAGGGCSGMQYGMAFEEKPQDYDHLVEIDGIRVIIDPTSMIYLKGATVDFVDSLMGGGFRIDNPNALSSCGCGHSFKASEDANSTSDHAASCNSCSH